MARKKKQEGHPEGHRPKGSNRAHVVLLIVATDSTFHLHGDPREAKVWVGRCIHCNARLTVTPEGSTGATVEHVNPLCAGGDPADPHNLALACASCNNEKGIRHDRFVGKGGRADEVIATLLAKRAARWREPGVQHLPSAFEQACACSSCSTQRSLDTFDTVNVNEQEPRLRRR